MFHRIGAAAYKADLTNTILICEILQNPQHSFKSVHIAGTNGKGSCSHMLSAIFQKAGYKTGLYTSPHLKDFRERIRINGTMIPEKDIIEFVKKYSSAFESIEPSFFEWTVGLAFNYFSREKVDIAIIETGLGGRLDSTNVVKPEISVITNISYDHVQLLGDTLEQIAVEKAGIIKPNVPIVIGEKQIETSHIFTQKADAFHSPLTFASDHLFVQLISKNAEKQFFKISRESKVEFEKLEISLVGNYQKVNVCTVLEAVHQLQKKGWNISKENIIDGLKDVQNSTGLLGRWQTISHNPLLICDVGHNKAGIKFILEQLNEYHFDKLRIVFGVVNDKDISGILELLPKSAIYYFCQANIPRAHDANELKKLASSYGLIGETFPSVRSAIERAKLDSSKNDLIFVGGSTFVVAEI